MAKVVQSTWQNSLKLFILRLFECFSVSTPIDSDFDDLNSFSIG